MSINMETSSNFPDCFYRITIKGFCVRDGKLMMVREAESFSGGEYELPGGGLDFGEDIRTGFEREVEEEMGLKVRKMSDQPVYLWTHRFENRRGMDWFYALVLGYRVEFEDLNITPSDECVAVEFFTKEEIAKLPKGQQMKNLHEIFDPADFAEEF